jgi:hypothetical protein
VELFELFVESDAMGAREVEVLHHLRHESEHVQPDTGDKAASTIAAIAVSKSRETCRERETGRERGGGRQGGREGWQQSWLTSRRWGGHGQTRRRDRRRLRDQSTSPESKEWRGSDQLDWPESAEEERRQGEVTASDEIRSSQTRRYFSSEAAADCQRSEDKYSPKNWQSWIRCEGSSWLKWRFVLMRRKLDAKN